jgi:hypothetical protein
MAEHATSGWNAEESERLGAARDWYAQRLRERLTGERQAQALAAPQAASA